MKEAEEIVDLAVKFKEQSDCIVIGVDLSGDPKVSFPLDFPLYLSLSTYDLPLLGI